MEVWNHFHDLFISEISMHSYLIFIWELVLFTIETSWIQRFIKTPIYECVGRKVYMDFTVLIKPWGFNKFTRNHKYWNSNRLTRERIKKEMHRKRKVRWYRYLIVYNILILYFIGWIIYFRNNTREESTWSGEIERSSGDRSNLVQFEWKPRTIDEGIRAICALKSCKYDVCVQASIELGCQ